LANGVPSEINFILDNWTLEDAVMELTIRNYHNWQAEMETKNK
jgi:hypothetical protein